MHEAARYWQTAGAVKTFTHPLDSTWLTTISRPARILDYGCGYGRTVAELSDLGFASVRGVDISPALIDRGRRARPDLDLAVIDSPPTLAWPAAAFDVVILLAVLTCIPDDNAQQTLIAELSRVLAPGGLIYVSDLLLQPDDRNVRRYTAHARTHGGPYGVFATDDGAVCRHHTADHLRRLFAGFNVLNERRVDVATMNGHPASALQMLVQKA
jgi:SAM-dependent methyltransferase